MHYNLSVPTDVEQAKQYLQKLIGEACPSVILQKKVKRTLSQNSLYHVWIRALAEHIGETDLNNFELDVKRAILGTTTHINKLTGQEEMNDWHTSQMTVAQLALFMEKFKAWAKEYFNYDLPYVGDIGYDKIYEQYGFTEDTS